jgi:hypothetical protein
MRTRASTRPPLWLCPLCGEQFTTRNQRHSCGSFNLDDLFAGTDLKVRRLYEKFREIVEDCGPVRVIPQKSRIAFQVRMRFAALMPQKNSLRGHLVLAERHDSPLFEKVETYSPRNHVHVFRLDSEKQLGKDFRRWVRQSYRVGCQEHLDRKPR